MFNVVACAIPPPYEWRNTQETKESTVTIGDTSRTDIEVHDIYPTSLGDDTPSKTIRFYDEPTTRVKGPQEKQDKEKPVQDYTPSWAYTASQTTQNVVGSPPTLSPTLRIQLAVVLIRFAICVYM